MSSLRNLFLALVRRLGGEDLSISPDDRRRVLVLLVVSALCALLMVDYARAPFVPLAEGDVPQRTVKAPFSFTFPDHASHEQARLAARESALPVYLHRADLVDERLDQVTRAFAAGREAVSKLSGSQIPQKDKPLQLNEELRLYVVQAFLGPLRIQLPEADVVALLEGGFSPKAEQLVLQLLDRAMRDHLVIMSRDQLPPDRRPIRVIHLGSKGRTENVRAENVRTEDILTDVQTILVPEEARQRVSLGLIESPTTASSETDAVGALARAMVTSNLQFEALATEEAREAAANAVPLEFQSIKRGQILIRAGEVVSQEDLEVYRALQEQQGEHDLAMEVLAVTLFLVLFLASLYHFASTWLAGFTNRPRDVATVGAMLVLTAMLAKAVVVSAEGVATIVGYEAEPRSVWFLVPVAGSATLVRLLLGVPWTLVFTMAASVVCGFVMEQQALPVAFFLISGVAGASAVEHSRERIAVVRAGFVVGVVNSVAVLLIHLVQLFVIDGELSLATTMRPFWSMIFAFAGGVASAFLVLGLVPVFESLGFVTDYRLMELANLNHPLLRQLMLRAPGSYHHSVIVGTLAEAGAQAIGANALLAKVASYFHDIGKSLKPQYFVENQQGGLNKHRLLDPYTSAHVIISHVVDGGQMAREHALPQPIIDNIYMHHGTGMLQYFYAEACSQVADPSTIDEEVFRYPGPKPNTREAGVIMLADKVEAATRTLKVPDEHNIRTMIGRIVSSVISDGQFSECPLTFQEIHEISETFVTVLVGIYHQRIEYPQTADLSRAGTAPAASTQGEERTPITLDLAPQQTLVQQTPGPHPVAAAPTPARPQSSQAQNPHAPVWPGPAQVADLPATDEDSDVVDYEALDYLPRSD
jgi:putative nucleotidyltransferase with HDIG domain